MQKPSGLSQHLCPREIELLGLVKEGLSKEQISKKMDITISAVSGYHSVLRRKGALPPLPPGTRGRRITHPDAPVANVPLVDPPALGFQEVVEEKEKYDDPPAGPKPRRRKGKEGVTISMRTIAQQLDNEIHEHVQNGGRLEQLHRWCLVLVGEILE